MAPATDRYNEIDRQYRDTESKISELSKHADSLYDARERTPLELIEEEKQARFDALHAAYNAEVELIEQEAAQRIEVLWEQYAEREQAVEDEFEPRLAPFRRSVADEFEDVDDEVEDVDDELEEVEFSSPEYIELQQQISGLRATLDTLRQQRIEARHIQHKARDAKLAADGRR